MSTTKSNKKSTNTKVKSNKQEKKVAKDLGGETTVASGALWGQKADVRNKQFLTECKTTSKPWYSLTEKTWNKIKKEAMNDSIRTPIMCIELSNNSKSDKVSLCVMRYLDFIGFGLDTKAQYLGNPVPYFVDASSFRVNADFMHTPFPQTLIEGHYPCYRKDFKFLGSNEHLVVIPWDDFINILDKVDMV